MTHVAIELPEEIASRLGEPGDLSRVALEAIAAQGYRSGKLTHAEVQKMLGFTSRWETDSFLKQAGAYLDYTEADLEQDLTVSRQITGV
ncbi:MAG TPA: UPF0175 family protein [Blastocatellia bacterium]|nr:UPF0175 family protein [Blastocatellia bacterium]